MAGNWWKGDTVVADEQQAPQRGGVFIPDQGAIDDARRAETSLGYQGEENARGNTRLTSDVENRRLEQTDKISERYNKDPTIAGYRESLGNFATALRTADTPQGDNALITAYVKVFDPGSVVNEGEREGVSSSQGALANIVEKAKRDFGMSESGLFTPEARARIRAEMSNIMGQRVKGYNQRRAYYEQQAQAFNLDPNLILGQHDATPFIEQFRDYDKRNRLGEYAPGRESRDVPGATADNPFQGVDPSALKFDIDQGTGAFGPNDGNLTPEQQAGLTAALRANVGNPNFGPETLRSIYTGLGIPVGSIPDNPAFFDAVRTGKAFDTTPDPSAANAARKKWAEDRVRAEMQAMGMETINSSPLSDKGFTGGLVDELTGVRDGIVNLVTGNGSFVQGYRDGRDITRAAQDMAREEHGVAPEVISSLMTPAGLVSRTNMARDAMAMGALTGFGEGEGFTDTVGKMTTGGALGYGGGKVVEQIAPAIANSTLARKASEYFGEGRAQKAQEFTDAADRQGLDFMAADVPGAYKSKFATGVAGMTLGGVPIKVAASKIVEKAKAAKDRIAGDVGRAGDNSATGQAAQKGMETWLRRTDGRGGQLFDAIPIKPDTPLDLAASKQTLAEINGALSSNPKLAALVRDNKLVDYQKALESGPLSWADTKAFRSYVGKIIGKPSLTSDGASDDAMRALYGSLSQDMEQAAAAHSPEAAKAFARANQYWRGRQSRIDDVVSKIVGKDRNLSAEQATAQLERWSREKGGDFNKLYRAMRSLPEDEANDVRAYFIDRMGMAPAGGQDAAKEVFSPDIWMTNWNSLSDRAKAVLFKGEHRKALDDLAKVFSGMKASRLFANPSGTGYSVWGATNAAMATTDLMTFGLSSVGQVGAGGLLGSPRFARWLVALGKKPNPSAQLAHIGQLTAIARSEPIIANDIFTLQQRLADAFVQPASLRSAAEENDDLGNPKVREGERNNAQ